MTQAQPFNVERWRDFDNAVMQAIVGVATYATIYSSAAARSTIQWRA